MNDEQGEIIARMLKEKGFTKDQTVAVLSLSYGRWDLMLEYLNEGEYTVDSALTIAMTIQRMIQDGDIVVEE